MRPWNDISQGPYIEERLYIQGLYIEKSLRKWDMPPSSGKPIRTQIMQVQITTILW